MFKAKAYLREFHEDLLKKRLDQLKEESWAEEEQGGKGGRGEGMGSREEGEDDDFVEPELIPYEKFSGMSFDILSCYSVFSPLVRQFTSPLVPFSCCVSLPLVSFLSVILFLCHDLICLVFFLPHSPSPSSFPFPSLSSSSGGKLVTGASKAEQDAMEDWESSAAAVVSVKYSPKLLHEEDVERLLVVVSPEEDAAALWRQR